MSTGRSNPPLAVYAGIFLIAAATLLFQVTFVRIFSVSIWYHFAFLVVSVALFGFGASGVALSLLGHARRDALYRALAPALFALTAVGAYLGTNAIPFSPFRIFQSPVQVFYFLLYDLLLMIPFFFAGTTVALILRSYPGRAGRLYAFDLVGAAMGTLLVFVALPWVGAPGAVVLAALLGALSSVFLAPTLRWRRALIVVAVIHVPFLAAPSWIPDIRMDDSKLVPEEINEKNGTLAFSKWNALSRIDVVERTWADPVIFIDAAAATTITPRRKVREARAELSTIGNRLYQQPSVVVVGAGGGVDVQNALAMGARHVTAVEINPIIIDLVTNRYARHVGNVFSDAKVTLVRDEGRSYIRRSAEQSDIIQITLIDTWAASVSGAYSLSENYLYTVEAFETYLDHLTPDGLLSITRWYYETPRVAALARAALEAREVEDPSRYIAVVRLGVQAAFLLKRTPFTQGEADAVNAAAASMGATVLHDPVNPAGDTFYDAFLAADDPSHIIAQNELDLTPTWDESPFFFQMTRWSAISLDALGSYSGENVLEPLAIPVGQAALITALGLGVLLSLILLAVPVVARKVPKDDRLKWLGYFLALGLAYIMVEVVLMQRLALFLGHPTYSVTTVLFAILLFSGLGAGWSDRRQGTTRDVLRPVLWLLPIAILLLVFVVPPMTQALIGLAHPLRLAIAIAIIAPVAFLMGAPFPVGIRAIGAKGGAHIPWAWAANGCASVIGSVLAVLGAMVWSFSVVLLAASVIYVLALAGITRWRMSL